MLAGECVKYKRKHRCHGGDFDGDSRRTASLASRVGDNGGSRGGVSGIAALPSILGTPTGGWGNTKAEWDEAATSYDWASLSPNQLASLKETNRNPNDLNPYVHTQTNKLLADARRAGFNLIISETARSPDRQRYLYAQGRADDPNSKVWDSQNIVTWTLDSNHIPGSSGGQALDLFVDGTEEEKKAGYQWIQDNAEGYGFGLGPAGDLGHIEMKDVPSPARRRRTTP